MLLDSFEILGPDGKHICLVHQPLGMSLHDLKMQAQGKVFSKEVLRVSIRQLLAALDFLHKDAHIIHSGDFIRLSVAWPTANSSLDLQPSNLLVGINDESFFFSSTNRTNSITRPPENLSMVAPSTSRGHSPFPLDLQFSAISARLDLAKESIATISCPTCIELPRLS